MSTNKTKDTMTEALHDLEGSLPCSNETCWCCAAIWPKVKRVLEIASPIRCY